MRHYVKQNKVGGRIYIKALTVPVILALLALWVFSSDSANSPDMRGGMPIEEVRSNGN